MPAKSKNQRRAAGMAMAMKKGDIPVTPGTAAGEMAEMPMDSLREFAATPKAGLPKVRRMGEGGQRKPNGRRFSAKKGMRRCG